MKTKKLIAAALAATMAVASLSTPSLAKGPVPVPVPTTGPGNPAVVWSVIGCAGGIVLSAFAANYRDNRELTAPEAWTCGLLFWFSQPKGRH
jgi:hypothetical protein